MQQELQQEVIDSCYCWVKYLCSDTWELHIYTEGLTSFLFVSGHNPNRFLKKNILGGALKGRMPHIYNA